MLSTYSRCRLGTCSWCMLGGTYWLHAQYLVMVHAQYYSQFMALMFSTSLTTYCSQTCLCWVLPSYLQPVLLIKLVERMSSKQYFCISYYQQDLDTMSFLLAPCSPYKLYGMQDHSFLVLFPTYIPTFTFYFIPTVINSFLNMSLASHFHMFAQAVGRQHSWAL